MGLYVKTAFPDKSGNYGLQQGHLKQTKKNMDISNLEQIGPLNNQIKICWGLPVKIIISSWWLESVKNQKMSNASKSISECQKTEILKRVKNIQDAENVWFFFRHSRLVAQILPAHPMA